MIEAEFKALVITLKERMMVDLGLTDDFNIAHSHHSNAFGFQFHQPAEPKEVYFSAKKILAELGHDPNKFDLACMGTITAF